MLTEKNKKLVKIFFSKKKRSDDVYVSRDGVFGISLSSNELQIPDFVLKCIEYLRVHGPVCEGVFRVSPPYEVLDELSHRLDNGENISFEKSVNINNKEVFVDPHIVASLLKKYFRELPQPLCTVEMYDMWIAAVSIKNVPTLKVQVKKVLQYLPLINLMLLKYLAEFLNYLSSFSEKTKMDINNLSICFAPNILRPPDNLKVLDQLEESPIGTALLKLLITDYNFFFDESTEEVIRKRHREITQNAGNDFIENTPVSRISSTLSSLDRPYSFLKKDNANGSIMKGLYQKDNDRIKNFFSQSAETVPKKKLSGNVLERTKGLPRPLPPTRAASSSREDGNKM